MTLDPRLNPPSQSAEMPFRTTAAAAVSSTGDDPALLRAVRTDAITAPLGAVRHAIDDLRSCAAPLITSAAPVLDQLGFGLAERLGRLGTSSAPTERNNWTRITIMELLERSTVAANELAHRFEVETHTNDPDLLAFAASASERYARAIEVGPFRADLRHVSSVERRRAALSRMKIDTPRPPEGAILAGDLPEPVVRALSELNAAAPGTPAIIVADLAHRCSDAAIQEVADSETQRELHAYAMARLELADLDTLAPSQAETHSALVRTGIVLRRRFADSCARSASHFVREHHSEWAQYRSMEASLARAEADALRVEHERGAPDR